MVLDVLHPVGLIKVLRYEVVSSLVADIPDFDSVRGLCLPSFGSEIEELVFAFLQGRPSLRKDC
jgi:hypothetical protein